MLPRLCCALFISVVMMLNVVIDLWYGYDAALFPVSIHLQSHNALCCVVNIYALTVCIHNETQHTFIVQSNSEGN